jgi:diguanylate cyclase (GGDEF)-like protein
MPALAPRSFRRLKKQSRIVVIAPAEPVEYFGLIWNGVRSASTEISSLGVSVESRALPNQDIEPQRELLLELLASAPDAIALIPAHAKEIDDLIERHADQGTAVVTFNADAPVSRRCAYVGPDALKSGALAAEVLTKLMGSSGEIVSFPGPLQKGHLAARYAGFLAELTGWRADARVVACHEGLENLQEAAVQLFDRHRDIGGIYVGNARAYEIGAALESIGWHIPCVGFDNTEAVRPYLAKGMVSAVIDQNAYQQGYVAVQRAYETIATRRAPARSTLIPSTVVFSSNATDEAATDTLNEAFELLVRRRTARMRSYQRLLQEANHQLMHLAETDALTGLFNRRKIEYLLDDHLARCTSHSPLSFLMIDVNHFKSYNDLWGHEIGDEALRVLARVMTEQVQSPDCCGRIGGDEFCILLPNTDEASAEALRARLHDAIGSTVIAAPTENLSIEISIGVATAPKQGTTPSDLLRAADLDMYAHKNRAVHRIGRTVIG